MIETDALHGLIQALAPAEKRYVRLFATKHLPQNGSRYLRLFDELQEMEQYDERKLMQQLGKEKKRTALASEKNYLYRFLLKSLRAFHEERTVDIRLKELLINASLLFEKRLYEMSMKELERARKLAVKHERSVALLEILQLQSDLIIERNPKKPFDELMENSRQVEDALRQLNDTARLKLLQDETFVYLRARYLLREEEHKRHLQNLAVQLEKFSVDHEGLAAAHLRLNMSAMLAICMGRFDAASQFYERMIALWDANPERAKEDVLPYMKLLSNYLIACHGQNNFEKMPELLARIRAIPCRSAEEEAERFQNISFIELLYRINVNALRDYDEYVAELEEGLELYQTKINEARFLLFLYNIAVGFFILGQSAKALNWISRIINRQQSDHRRDIQHTARILRLVFYYELGKHDLLEYELINVERYLRQRKAWYAYEASVVRLLKKLLDMNSEPLGALFEKFILQLDQATEGRDSAALPGSTELKLWARSYIEERSIAALLFGEKMEQKDISVAAERKN